MRLGSRAAAGVWRLASGIDAATQGLRRSLLAMVLVAAMFVSLPSAQPQAAAAGASYYVDSIHGSDANPGTSPDRPWRTLAPVHAHDFLPGEVLNFARGSDWSGGLVIDDSGVAGNPITYRAYGSGAMPIFRNSGPWSRAVTVNADWVVVEGLAVRDAQEFGVFVSSGSDHNVIRDCTATQVGMGYGISGQYNLLTRSQAYDLKMVVNTPGGDDDYGALAVCLYNSYNEVSYNRFERCRASSYDYGTDGGGVELYGNVTGSRIHHNWVSDGNGFIEVGGGAARDTVVAYNVSVNNGSFCWLHLSGNFASAVTDFRVENNTIVETLPGDVQWLIFGFSADPGPDTLILRNNVVYADRFQLIANKASFTHEHNIYTLREGYTQLGFALARGEQLADPLFVDPDSRDYHLQAASPAIDGGLDLGYTLDLDGQAVPSGRAPDMGAFEYRAPASVVTATLAPTPTATASPTPTPGPKQLRKQHLSLVGYNFLRAWLIP